MANSRQPLNRFGREMAGWAEFISKKTSKQIMLRTVDLDVIVVPPDETINTQRKLAVPHCGPR